MDTKRIFALRDKVERTSVSTAVILLHFIPECKDSFCIHNQSFRQVVIILPLKNFYVGFIEDSGSKKLLVFRIIYFFLCGSVSNKPLSSCCQTIILCIKKFLELFSFIILALLFNSSSDCLNGKVSHIQLHHLQCFHNSLEKWDNLRHL